MDLLKSHRRRSRLSEVVYVALNLALAATLLVIAQTVPHSPWLALFVVILSKFRALMVRPRFWWANLVANLPDIIVGLSVVVLLYTAAGVTWLQALVAVAFAIWLLFIKPRSKRSYVAIQAGVTVMVGVTALSMVSFGWDSIFFVLGMWVIGYVATRHTLGSYDEPLTMIYSLLMGLVFAELGWIAYHWLFAYNLPGFGGIKFSQLALFMILLCLVAERAYASYHHHGMVRRQDIAPPLTLALSVIAILLLLFSGLNTITPSI